MSTFLETIEFMYEQLPMYQRQGQAAYKKDLSNIIALCDKLGNPELSIRTIHVAGTNGKGSVSHMIASLLQEYNYKVGLYTSPHYKDFRERIKINGELVSKLYVIGFIKRIKPYLEEIQPSFFEITVAMAFDYFAKQKVDFAIIETGVGGRLDSTNIITPLISIITNISIDHVQMLGDTLPKIAFEKAGIIKEKVPVVVGKRAPETDDVFIRKAETSNAPLSFAEDYLSNSELNKFAKKLTYPGPYQNENLRTALTGFRILEELEIVKWQDKKVGKALSKLRENTYFIGRWEKLGEHPIIIADSAHNEGGLKIALEELKKLKFENLHFVLGFVNDKEVSKVLKMFPKEASYYFAKADIPRGLAVNLLLEQATQTGLSGNAYSSVENALSAAKEAASPNDLIYVGGSIFVVAEILP
ncbi:bifunctional folylpolyglutamate synthase/dihydrofolate synthase [Portibacter lacus]|uniref:Dihydrofolate synthase/folylpolyglutamate synthase n=1 Tax=Portibacter lacus TaxID=1099794 RepID=A0AA37STM5_9BACT|nr:folylpolyglutamate synthase/dihydrofolate synthase family protein [Portibacter lacus]GLR19399.1 tetrahydrofolate synthase [Portibacter lacus]